MKTKEYILKVRVKAPSIGDANAAIESFVRAKNEMCEVNNANLKFAICHPKDYLGILENNTNGN